MSESRPIRWRTWTGLALVAASVAFGWWWTWGVLFLWWAASNLRSGEAHFVEPVTRTGEPITYWSVVVTWLLLALWSIGWDVLRWMP